MSTRLAATIGCLLILCGCRPPSDATRKEFINDERAIGQQPAVTAFHFDKSRQVISLDTRIAPRQRQRFDIGLGSITLETVRVTDNTLTFHYTPEVEGGYTTYECTVPVSPTPVEIQIAPGGTPGATSFDLARCKVIRKGNTHWE